MAFTVHDILYAKRKGLKHSSEEIKSLVNGYVAGDVADYQVSAWLMAACINGLDSDETSALTQAMVDSGETIDLSSLGGTTVDKHSTGGVGDKITLPLVLAYRRGTDTERAFWRGAIEQGESDDAQLEHAIDLLKKHHAIEDTVERARHFGSVSRDALAPLPESPHKDALLEVVDFCIERAY